MNRPSNILATTDFSGPARHAADRAARLAHETGAALTLLNVLPGAALQDLRQWLGAGDAMAQSVIDDARAQLERLGEELQSTRHVPVRCVQATGAVLDEILREADALDSALLVLGARGAGFMRRLLLGTTAERLLRRTTRPLLVVRSAAHEPYRRVLLAVDFSPWSTQVLALARRMAPHAHFIVLNAFQVPFEEKLRFAGVDAGTIEQYRRQARAQAVQRVHALAQEAGLRPAQWTPCIVEGDASQRIAEQEQEQDADLVVLGKHGQSATEDLLLGSVTKHVLAEGSVDVLVSTAREG